MTNAEIVARIATLRRELDGLQWQLLGDQSQGFYSAARSSGLADIFREAFGPEHGFEPLGAEFSLTAAQMAELHEP